jgi:WD40 repeat protein
VAFSPDGLWLATGGRDNLVQIIDTRTWTVSKELKGHQSPVQGVAFSPDSTTLASSSEDATIRLWEVKSGKALRALTLMKVDLGRVTFSADGKYVMAGNNHGLVACWEVLTGARAGSWSACEESVGMLSSIPGTDLIVGTGEKPGVIRLWDFRLRPGRKM